MRIGLLTAFDATDIHAFSGTAYFAARAMQKHGGEVEFVHIRLPWPRRLWRRLGGERLAGRLWGARSKPRAAFWGSEAVRRQVMARIQQSDIDVLLAFLCSPEAAELGGLDVPLVYMSDATVELMRTYYGRLTELAEDRVGWEDALERRAIGNAACCVYPTRWAADSAVCHYGKDPDAVHVIPYGANLVEVPGTEDVWRLIQARDLQRPRILLVGKGRFGRKAANVPEMVRCARCRGLDLQLTVVGFGPEEVPWQDPAVTFVPYLDKAVPADSARLHQLYSQADLFLLPTRAETFGIVFCEAMAYGLPIVSNRTGGASHVVQDGRNGILLEPGASPEDYVDAMLDLFSQPERYRALAAGARSLYDRQYNWDAFGRSLAGLLQRVVEAE